jgi:nitrite reductase/ring-hydroxylating ferredoxin subunit
VTPAATRDRQRHAVPRAQLEPEGRTVIVAGRREIAVFEIDGELYAVFNRCPHHRAALSEGVVYGTAELSEVNQMRYDPDRPILRCPWHRYEFDLATGRCPADPQRLRVATYDVRAEGDEIAVYV